MQKTIIDLNPEESAEVICFQGCQTQGKRLEEMGIREGKIISRVSSQFIGGPVIVSVDGRQTAMGRKMAAKILVEPVAVFQSAAAL
ncbi:FeoA family protein [Balneolales bacterium ANBcel1]|nr:FeoA family protein [Balneolales bacterium ANBcel1]